MIKTFILLLCFLSSTTYACNFSEDIKKVEGGFLYTLNCHKKVGKLVVDSKKREEQIRNLNEAVKLKDLAISFSEKKSILWKQEADAQYKIVQRQHSFRKYEKALWFAGGLMTTILSVWAAGQLNNR